MAEVRTAIADVNTGILRIRDELEAVLNAAKTIVQEKHTAFGKLHADFLQQYETASAAQANLGSILADYRRLSAELEQAERAVQSTDEDRKKFATARYELGVKRAALAEELTNLRRLLNEAAERVEAMSSGTLRARVEEERIPEQFQEALIELCEKCAIRELEQRCSDKVEDAAKDGGAGWETLLQHLLTTRHALIRAGDGAELDPNLLTDTRGALGWELTDNQAKAVLSRLDDARLGRLLSSWAAPFVRFEYRDRGTYMPFERASPGQQASALLTLLLNQEAGTLIIDQPEDDLDNRVIMVIVKLLQTTKRRRQLIFATHNPNFVVNGDADKVVGLAPNVEPAAPDAVQAAQIEIETDGAIETPSVRKAITDTMEGGREAFELRSRKYAFEPEMPIRNAMA